jgi:hypothetical protein
MGLLVRSGRTRISSLTRATSCTTTPVGALSIVCPVGPSLADSFRLPTAWADGQSHTVYRRRADIAREGGSVEGDADLRAFDVWGTLDSPGLVRAYRSVVPSQTLLQLGSL